ncbi:MAG: response regulator, partial [Hyphomicrobiaceae bacterium]
QLPKLTDILIVEDETFDADRLQATLGVILGRDIQIRRAETLASALDRVIERMPDMIFLDDYLKPCDTAVQTLPLLRRAGYDGPIIVISGEIDRRRQAELKDIGAAACLHKDNVDSGSVTEALNAAFNVTDGGA